MPAGSPLFTPLSLFDEIHDEITGELLDTALVGHRAVPLHDAGGKEHNLKRFIGNNGWDGSDGTDATAMMNYALSEIQPDGPARIVIPADISFNTPGGAGGGYYWVMQPLYDDLEIVGAHRDVKIHLRGTTQLAWIGGNAKAHRLDGGNGSDWLHYTWFGVNADEDEYPRLPVLPVTATIPKHALSITLVNQADADSIAADDYITITTGQTFTGGAFTNNQPDAEVLRVRSKSGTGNRTLNLYWPTSVSYAQEYYISGTIGETSTSVTANAAPFGVQRITDHLLSNIAFRNFTVVKHTDHAINYPFAFNGGNTAWLTLEDIDFWGLAGSGFETVGFGNIGKTVRNCRVWIQNTGDRWVMAADTGASYYRFLYNQVWVDGKTNIFHVNEGVKRCVIHGNQITGPEWTGTTRMVAVQARGYDLRITGNDFAGGPTNDADIFIQYSVTGGGLISGNTHQKSAGEAVTVQSGATGWEVDPGRSNERTVSVATPNTIRGWRRGSATYDPPSLSDGATTTTTVTVTGAALGDVALASFSLNLQGIIMTAYVSAANTVTVVLQNETGGTINLGSGTLRAEARSTTTA